VTGTMFITACMLGVLTFTVWRWHPALAGLATGVFLLVDGLYLASNMTKLTDGGWFPLMVATVVFILLTTWAKGRSLVRARVAEDMMAAELFIASASPRLERVPGTAIFLSAARQGIPPALLHNVKHNKVLHERNLILTLIIEQVPAIADAQRLEVEDLGDGFFRVFLRYGFMEEMDVPAALDVREICGGPFKQMETSYFLSRQTLIPSARPGMALWREHLFAWMVRNAESAMEFFRLPTNRVVELGSQVEI
jgi:KUP system potassium uptake protein